MAYESIGVSDGMILRCCRYSDARIVRRGVAYQPNIWRVECCGCDRVTYWLDSPDAAMASWNKANTAYMNFHIAKK